MLPPSFPPYFTQIDEIRRYRDVTSLPEKTEVGENSISNDEINTNSDSDSDNNKSDVLKQVPKKFLTKGDDGKLKDFFSAKVLPRFLALVFVH